MSDPFVSSRCRACGFVHYPQHDCPLEDLKKRVESFEERIDRIWGEWTRLRDEQFDALAQERWHFDDLVQE